MENRNDKVVYYEQTMFCSHNNMESKSEAASGEDPTVLPSS